MIEPEAVKARLEVVQARISDAGGDLDRVRVLAVTKGFGPEAVVAAVAAGLDEVGENYAQELVSKLEDLVDSLDVTPRVHFIGRLQRNKVRTVAPYVACWQTIDRLALAIEVAKRAPCSAVLVQLNLSGEKQKGGCDPDETEELVVAARELGLDVQGLMGVGPTGPPELARPGFRRLVELADELELPVRSIGMSADLEVAVQEGTTMVRIGTDLFGPRPSRDPSSGRDGGPGAPSK